MRLRVESVDLDEVSLPTAQRPPEVGRFSRISREMPRLTVPATTATECSTPCRRATRCENPGGRPPCVHTSVAEATGSSTSDVAVGEARVRLALPRVWVGGALPPELVQAASNESVTINPARLPTVVHA
jgi:hypothetical protein